MSLSRKNYHITKKKCKHQQMDITKCSLTLYIVCCQVLLSEVLNTLKYIGNLSTWRQLTRYSFQVQIYFT